MRLNSEQALTPVERDLGVVGDSSQKSSGHRAAGAKTATFPSYIKVDHAHVFEYCGCPSLHISRKKWRQRKRKRADKVVKGKKFFYKRLNKYLQFGEKAAGADKSREEGE